MKPSPRSTAALCFATALALAQTARADSASIATDTDTPEGVATKPDDSSSDGDREARSRHVSGNAGPPSNDNDPGKPALRTEGSWWQGPWLLGSWRGKRHDLEERGFIFDANLKTEGSAAGSTRGGRALLDLDLTVDGKTAWGIEGATLFLESYATAGRPSLSTGAIQGATNIETAQDVAEISQVWWEQWGAEQRWRLKIGKVDANTEFDTVAAAGTLLNGAAGYSPTIVTLPTYPNPALGLNLFYYPTQELRLALAVYDGSGAQGVATGSGSLGRAIDALADGSRFFVTEMSWARSQGEALTHRIAGGAWASRTAGQSPGSPDLWGLYGLGQKNILSSPQGRTVDAFFQAGWSDPDAAPVQSHVALGLLVTAPSQRRSGDTLAIYLSSVDGPDMAREGVLEVAYTLSFSQFLAVTLDGQTIHDPGGDPAGGTDNIALVRISWTL